MENAPPVLLDLPGFRVVGAGRVEDELEVEGRLLVVVETVEPAAACPERHLLAGRVHERPLVRVKDLPVRSGRLRLVRLVRLKRRRRCDEPLCPRRSSAEDE